MKSPVTSESHAEHMSARAIASHVRISPRKVRLVLGTIRRRPVAEAFSILSNLKQKGARIVSKLLTSAVANAKQKKMDENQLMVRLAFADGGPMLKRFLPRAMGRADGILKHTSHITLVLEEGAVRREIKTETKEKKTSSKKLFGAKAGKAKTAQAGAV